MKNLNTRIMIFTALFAAIAVVLYIFEFPLFPAAPFLKLDLSDLPALVATFMFGPLVGISVSALKNVLHFMLMSQTGGIGEIANFVYSLILILSVGVAKNRKFPIQIMSIVTGIVLSTIFMCLFNLFVFLPMYGQSSNIAIIFEIYVPFNLIKGIIIAVVYFAIQPFLKKRIKPLIS